MNAIKTDFGREEAVAVLLAVMGSKHPRIALPAIASNHQLTLPELQTFLHRCGYPNNNAMRLAARRIADHGTIPEPRLRTAEQARHDAKESGGGMPKSAPADHGGTPAMTTTPTAPSGARAGEPYVTALPATALFADDAYQRDLDEARVGRMTRDYDPALVGIIEVSARRDPAGDVTRYAILDGQHRWALVRNVADDSSAPHLVCRVHTGLTIDEEATLYHRLNTTRKQLTGWDRWKARRSAGDPVALAIEKAATDAGYTISYRLIRGTITATKACENVYKIGGTPLLVEVLNTIRTAYRDDTDAVTAGIIHGLGHILSAYDRDELDHARLVEALAGIVPRQLNARAAAVREIHKGTTDKLTAHVIVDQYNQLRRAGQVTAFFDRVRPQTANKGTQRAADLEHAATVRAWARENGLIAPAATYVPKDVHTAYAAAHPEEPTA